MRTREELFMWVLKLLSNYVDKNVRGKYVKGMDEGMVNVRYIFVSGQVQQFRCDCVV